MGYEFYDALTKYKSAMEQAKAMLNKGLITIEEYAIIDTNMCGRFGVDLDSLYRDNDLIMPRRCCAASKGVNVRAI